MGILNSIKEKLFGKSVAEPVKSEAVTQGAVMQTVISSTPAEPVDVEAVLEAAVKAKGVKLNWRVSIVDLMKALDLDSSLAARKELAKDLNYTGTDPDGSAEKNIWLHKALMKTLAENGGKIPNALLG
jgi:hypothetical protein